MQNPFSRSPGRRGGIPIHPGAFPLIGHLPAIYYGLPEVIRRAQAEIGPLFWITTGVGWMLFCTGPEAVEIFRNRAFDSAHLEKLAPVVASGTMLAWMTVTLAHRPELWDALVAEAGDAEAIPTTPEAARAFPHAPEPEVDRGLALREEALEVLGQRASFFCAMRGGYPDASRGQELFVCAPLYAGDPRPPPLPGPPLRLPGPASGPPGHAPEPARVRVTW